MVMLPLSPDSKFRRTPTSTTAVRAATWCDFAHGLDELTGEGREEFLRELAKQKKEKEQEACLEVEMCEA